MDGRRRTRPGHGRRVVRRRRGGGGDRLPGHRPGDLLLLLLLLLVVVGTESEVEEVEHVVGQLGTVVRQRVGVRVVRGGWRVVADERVHEEAARHPGETFRAQH